MCLECKVHPGGLLTMLVPLVGATLDASWGCAEARAAAHPPQAPRHLAAPPPRLSPMTDVVPAAPYVPVERHASLAALGLVLGVLGTASVFLVESRDGKGFASLLLSLALAGGASLAWAVGIVFGFMWAGVFL